MVPHAARAAVLRRRLGRHGGASAIGRGLMAAVVSITAMAGLQALGASLGQMDNVAIGAAVEAPHGSG